MDVNPIKSWARALRTGPTVLGLLIGLGGFVVANAQTVSQSASQPAIKDLYDKPDVRGQACIRCHSPRKIEFTAFGFPEAEMARRARQHLSADEATTLAHLLASAQAKNTPDPFTALPYQPGGQVLTGSSPSERDLRFGQELQKFTPALLGSPIQSMAQALAARDELLRLDPRRLPVGIAMSLLSEDKFHGPAHASLNDWFADVPVPDRPDYLAAREAYRSNPSQANLTALETILGRMRGSSMFEQMSIAKYGALLLWADSVERGGPEGALDMKLLGNWNPFWLVGEVARQNLVGDPLQLSVPADVMAKKSGGPSLAEQMAHVQLAWMWMGWTLDPALTHTIGTNHATMRGDYFVRALQAADLPIHIILCMSKKLVEQGYNKAAWRYAEQQHFELQYTYMLIDGNLYGREPKEPSHRELFRKIALNSFRLSLYLMLDDLGRTHSCVRPESQLNQIKYIREYFAACHCPKADLDLCNQAEQQLKAAKVEAR